MPRASAGKYLTFSISDEDYGLAILKVREIIGMMPITPMPHSPDYVKGVINLRDKVIPVIDSRLRFSMDALEYDNRVCIVIVEAQSSKMSKCWEVKNCGKDDCPAHGSADRRCWMISGTFCRNEIQGTFHEKIEACRKCEFYQLTQSHVFTAGLVVDSVSEVIDIKADQIEDTPKACSNDNSGGILGIAKCGNNLKMLLDIDEILRDDVDTIRATFQ